MRRRRRWWRRRRRNVGFVLLPPPPVSMKSFSFIFFLSFPHHSHSSIFSHQQTSAFLHPWIFSPHIKLIFTKPESSLSAPDFIFFFPVVFRLFTFKNGFWIFFFLLLLLLTLSKWWRQLSVYDYVYETRQKEMRLSHVLWSTMFLRDKS